MDITENFLNNLPKSIVEIDIFSAKDDDELRYYYDKINNSSWRYNDYIILNNRKVANQIEDDLHFLNLDDLKPYVAFVDKNGQQYSADDVKTMKGHSHRAPQKKYKFVCPEKMF